MHLNQIQNLTVTLFKLQYQTQNTKKNPPLHPLKRWNILSPLPHRFCKDCLQLTAIHHPRLNIYSKANIIGSIVTLLQGTLEFQSLLETQLARLFQLPVASIA